MELRSFENADALARSAAESFLKGLRAKHRAGTFGVALSGGRIAPLFYKEIVRQTSPGIFRDVHFFWADERCVPPTSGESNYRDALENLFAPLSIPTDQVHRIPGETEPPFAAAQAQAELCRLMPLNSAGQPVLDLVILGMGEDGHVASLFPEEDKAFVANEEVYRPVVATKPPPHRITIGYQTIFAARKIWLLASGSGKKEAFRKLIRQDISSPVGRIAQERRDLEVFQDIEPMPK